MSLTSIRGSQAPFLAALLSLLAFVGCAVDDGYAVPPTGGIPEPAFFWIHVANDDAFTIDVYYEDAGWRLLGRVRPGEIRYFRLDRDDFGARLRAITAVNGVVLDEEIAVDDLDWVVS